MYINVNNIDLYYEKSGCGTPIILLHGNGESTEIFRTIIPMLSEQNAVYAIDSRGHGKSGKTVQMSYIEMAEDIAQLILKLKIDKPILYGFSDGGIIGLLIASKYPDLLSKLIVSGANTNPGGLKYLELIKMKIGYLLTKDVKLKLMIEEPDITNEELNKITVPVLVLAGEKDMVKRKHTVNIADNIRNSTLKILDGETHSSYVLNSPKLYENIKFYIK